MARVTTESTAGRRRRTMKLWHKWWWLFLIVSTLVAGGALAAWRLASTEPAPTEPPEAAKVLQAQEAVKNFGILIPAYLPKGFDRAGVEIKISDNGPSGEPSVDLVYRTKKGATIFLHEWIPGNPELQTLVGSRAIETKWGKGWLLTQSESLVAVWVDLGPLRVSISTSSPDVVYRERMLLAANTLGLASNMQAFSFTSELPVIKDMAPPPPFDVPTNEQGIQELNLTITPGGYSPMRFAVQKDVPVKLNFRALGEVGCGSTLIFPTESGGYAALSISAEQKMQSIEFTPQLAGDFAFHCTTNCYRGIMTVEGKNQQ